VLGTEARRRAVTRRCMLRNSKQVPVDVQVMDVFPRSDHKELKVRRCTLTLSNQR